ncbi:MAG TPA: hypothetical protein VNL16_19560 [Chloroflexota bacterium]|nr:hypothetical protein [Chloroflexota bacterium]
MPFCPFCRAEYRPGFTECVDCRVELVDELPPLEPEPVSAPVKEASVATFPSQLEAEMWAELLRGEGIPSVLVSLGPGAGGWGNSVFVPYQLRVRDFDADRARQLLPPESR